MLSAPEISKLHLSARLAVLSCCHTGRGYLTADGVVGLVRSLLVAGARGVVASNWDVDEPVAFAARLMPLLYLLIFIND